MTLRWIAAAFVIGLGLLLAGLAVTGAILHGGAQTVVLIVGALLVACGVILRPRKMG